MPLRTLAYACLPADAAVHAQVFNQHQLVKNLQGDVLSDREVRHVFSVKHGLIKSMDLKGEEACSSSGPSAAFAKH